MLEATETPAAGEAAAVQTGANGSPATPVRDEATVKAISDGLAGVFGTSEPADEPVEQPAAEGETPAATTEEKPGEEAATTEKPEEGTHEEQPTGAAANANKPATKAGEAAPTLPDAYVRSLKSRGWTDETIASDYQKLGVGFLDFAERTHRSRNEETAQMAAMGRKARDENAPTQPQQRQQQIAETPSGLKPIDAAKLKEKYGEDETMIDEIVGPVNAAIEHINKILPAVQQTQQRSQQAESEMLGQRVNEFFAGKELEPYKEVYGNPATATLSGEHVAARNKVLELADALLVGAKLQRRDLSLGEAMQMAHDAVSGDFKEQAVRTTIKKELKQRNQSITLKPTARNATGQFKGGGGKDARLAAVTAGLKKAFG